MKAFRSALRRTVLAAVWAGLVAPAAGQSPGADAVLGQWLARQTNLTTWSADFVQTRNLRALTQPLTTPGRVWFRAPAQFRWELGRPAQSVALRGEADLLILAPKLKRAERYPLAAFATGPMGDALALLDTGFPRDAASFTNRFAVLGLTETNATHAFRLQPRAKAAQKVLTELTVFVATNDFQLRATELVFRDGSRLRNDFTNAAENAPLAAGQFEPGLDATWKVTEPLQGRQP